MASSTITSSSHATRIYDVFVSFRGETRNNFTGFLFEALRRKGIHAFKDDKDINKGESIAPELLQAIEESRLFIVVFSKCYASSTWCLRELAHICNCIRTSPRRVLPIFYEVNPSEVRKQGGFYQEAFAQHKEKFREDKKKMEEVKTWTEALAQVANLSGWDIQNKPQYAEIEEIVREITNVLGPKYLCLPKDNLVGMESRLQQLAGVLCLGLTNVVRVVGICGMSGIGKTTLVRALYERISHQYDFRCYIEDVSKTYRDSSALGVQKQLLSHLPSEKNLEVFNMADGTCLLWTRLRHARALIVFDNVEQVGQLKIFTGSRDTLLRECLGEGSRIIIISRDQQILRTHGVDDVYQVRALNYEDALNLFCKNAFKTNYVISDYALLTREVLSHAQGHPLAIEVLASSLFGRNVLQWRSALARLRQTTSKNIMDVLRISFDGLEDSEKEMFLDIACFSSLFRVQYLEEFSEFRGYYPEYGLQILIDKSLIAVTCDGDIFMHNLLRNLGKFIVREKSPNEPWKWSRIWDYEDLCKLLSDDKTPENLEIVSIECPDTYNQRIIRTESLSKMSRLKMFMLLGQYFPEFPGVLGRLENLSNELRYLIWTAYPFESLPPRFEPDKIVQLYLPFSNIKQLWEGTKPLHNLRRLDLSHSKKLIDVLDFTEALNLETINLEGCTQLRQIDPSIGHLRKLTILNLKGCRNLTILPYSLFGLNSLEYLNLSGCSKLNSQLSDELMKKVHIDEAPIHSQSTSSYSRSHKESVGYLLPSSSIFPCMRILDLSFCNLLRIPNAIANLSCLERLDLIGNKFSTLPNLKQLSKLIYLRIQDCKQLKYLPELPLRIDGRSTSLFYCPRVCPLFELHQPKWFSAYNAGLYIFNCPKLVERERFTSIRTSWMIQMIQIICKMQCPSGILPCERFAIVTPESEIPSWFNNQYLGKFIWIDTSSVVDYNNCIGIASCVIFTTRHFTPLDVAEHMCVFFNKLRVQSNDCSRGLSITYHAEVIANLRYVLKSAVEVKKYGYRWVYREDLELSNLTTMYNRDLLSKKRKFLEIEQNEGRNGGKRSKGRISAERGKDAVDSMENTIKLLQNQFANLGL
ncbi:hypothetical protein Fmac_021299 [Flemingia macrophylla]|uniref:TIR domain-containing protein n=1 Tax=Flemingia macrophylla TaxID=520843 RepID=A0ABD1LWQ5_9FABA